MHAITAAAEGGGTRGEVMERVCSVFQLCSSTAATVPTVSKTSRGAAGGGGGGERGDLNKL